MKYILQITLTIVLMLSLISNASSTTISSVKVDNTSSISRTGAVIEVALNTIPALDRSYGYTNNLYVIDEAGKVLLSQLVDVDSDSLMDQIIFIADITANSSSQFTIGWDKRAKPAYQANIRSFCRFAPERLDDFAWENDKVAFRTYGLELQKMAEQGTPGGLISSGIDCWLKTVDYSILDIWYAKEAKGQSYHVDNGEGKDNYHVGESRGCGGTAIVVDGKKIASGNFESWKVISNGPIRSIFELKYIPYTISGEEVIETKRISIDLGDNYYRCDVSYSCNIDIKKIAIGVTNHEKEGIENHSVDNGYITYWELLDDGYVGTGMFVDLSTITKIKYSRDFQDNWIEGKIKDGKFTYWAGFGLEKNGSFTSADSWNSYIDVEVAKKQAPLKITPVKK